MTTLDRLSDAFALIEDPTHWCRGTMARDASGVAVSLSNQDAVQWCISGACRKAGARGWLDASYAVYGVAPETANDRYGHEAALKVLAFAAAMEEAQ